MAAILGDSTPFATHGIVRPVGTCPLGSGVLERLSVLTSTTVGVCQNGATDFQQKLGRPVLLAAVWRVPPPGAEHVYFEPCPGQADVEQPPWLPLRFGGCLAITRNHPLLQTEHADHIELPALRTVKGQ